jgi:quinol monooxygenase YgiN
MVYTIVVHLYAKPEAEAISKLKAKLVEASQVYSKDKETLSWFVMQDIKDERAFTIVERYEQESVCDFEPHPRFSFRLSF